MKEKEIWRARYRTLRQLYCVDPIAYYDSLEDGILSTSNQSFQINGSRTRSFQRVVLSNSVPNCD